MPPAVLLPTSFVQVHVVVLLLSSSSRFELTVWILRGKSNVFVHFRTLPRDTDKWCAAATTELY